MTTNLPPFMGFQQEAYEDGGTFTAFYTCVIGPFRVFVYCPGGLPDDGWVVERKVNEPTRPAATQFFSWSDRTGDNRTTMQTNTRDPIAIMAAIQHLTSESNEQESAT